jgi:predicted RNA-binding protein with PIN domain
MSVSYVVDGYNLLFYLGLLDPRAGPQALDRARRRLLELVRTTLGEGDHEITVVFDSGRNRRQASPQEYLGIQVCFSAGGEFADDVIEAMIAESRQPQSLVVVSNDHRIQQAARRRGAHAWGCAELLDYGEQRDAPQGSPRVSDPERPAPTRDEVRHWLAEFGDLADDPGYREVFDPFPFKDES